MPRLESTAEPARETVRGPPSPAADAILTPQALAFLADLHRAFEGRRQELLATRRVRQDAFDAGDTPGFLPETQAIRDAPWTVAPVPPPLQDRRVEITGPVDRKMMIGAMNSGAKVFMADYEDSNSPTWANCIEGQRNVRDAVRRVITYAHPTKGEQTLVQTPATLVIRPRGWHLEEKHLLIDGHPISASLFDFGLDFWHNARERVERGQGPFYYLPKLEHHLEARLWNDVFLQAHETLGLPLGTIKATVLIETLPAAFQMDEILWQLRQHVVGLNAGRWDYIFSCIKTLRAHPDKVFPDRAQVTMTVPFMRAYARLLVKTCHKRGAFAMGGMSAFIPDRRDPAVNERALAAVRADKEREVKEGCDGTWVAHPDLVPVAMEVFDAHLQGAPNQVGRQHDDQVRAEDLLSMVVPGGTVTDAGLRNNIEVGIRYLEAWLQGRGAVAIHSLMEDAATAEISRSQVWQWVHHAAKLADGRTVTREGVQALVDEIAGEVRAGGDADLRHVEAAADLFAEATLADDFPAFLTLPAYERLTVETVAVT